MTELDLTPLEQPEPQKRRSFAALRNWLLVGLVVAAIGFVLFQALTSARVFFYNVDEAVERRSELDQAFRMQGTLVKDPDVAADGSMLFTLGYNSVTAEVRHIGDEPSDLFQIDVPVVVEGQWDGEVFTSSQILVKHSESYVEDNAGRLADAGEGYEPGEGYDTGEGYDAGEGYVEP